MPTWNKGGGEKKGGRGEMEKNEGAKKSWWGGKGRIRREGTEKEEENSVEGEEGEEGEEGDKEREGGKIEEGRERKGGGSVGRWEKREKGWEEVGDRVKEEVRLSMS